MNKIYKVVWSKVKHCYVVTSELAKRQTKGCGARSLRMAAVTTGVTAALLCNGGGLPFCSPSVAEAANVFEYENTSPITLEASSVNTNLATMNEKDYVFGNFKFTVKNGPIVTPNIYVISPKAETRKVDSKTIYVRTGIIESEYNNNYPASNCSVTMTGGTLCELYGAYGGTKNAENNKVTVSGSTVVTVYGGYSLAGAANGNAVEISGATVISSLAGGYGRTGGADGNTLTVNNSTVCIVDGGSSTDGPATNNTVKIGSGTNFSGDEYYRQVVGGFSNTGAVSGNTVEISGGEISCPSLGVYGGWSNENAASDNTVTISGGTVNSKVYGGWTTNGTAGGANTDDGNKVIINGGTINDDVYGGYSSNKNATGNTVTISGGTAYKVYGAFTEGGAAETNHVVVSGGVIGVSGTIVSGGQLYGGLSSNGSGASGNVTGNTVTVEKGTVLATVYGGSTQAEGNGNQSGDATENIVTIKDGTLAGDMYGGYSSSLRSTSGKVEGNIINITGGVLDKVRNIQVNGISLQETAGVGRIYGGYTHGNDASGIAKDNVVTISGGTLRSDTEVTGGYSNANNAEHNIVKIESTYTGTAGNVIGGEAGGNGTAKKNEVTISGGTVRDSNDSGVHVFGGKASTGSAIENKVTINKNATINSHVDGGYTTAGTAENNEVTIDGGNVNGVVNGGSISYEGDTTPGAVTGNTVTIKNGSKVGFQNASGIDGGYVAGGRSYGDLANAGDVTENKVFIMGGEVYDVYGGLSELGTVTLGSKTLNSGDVTKNEVEISGGTVSGGVYGGWTTNGAAGGSADAGNKVTVDGKASLYGVYGGYSQSGAVSYNTVDVKDCEWAGAFGGYSESGGAVSYNTVTMSDGNSFGLYGGENYNGTGDVTHNTVTLKGGSVQGYLFGGYIDEHATDGTGKATNNKVEISGGTVTQHGYGYVLAGGRTKDGDALDNTVTISAGEIGKWNGARNDKTTLQIAGGYVYGYGGKATGNAIDISGGTFGGAYEIDTGTGVETGELGIVVFGGYTNGTDSGIAASDNTVTISGSAVLTGAATIAGGSSNQYYGSLSSADDNTVTISGGTIGTGDQDSNIYGGLGGGTASGNTVTIKEKAELNKNTNVYGGKAAVYYEVIKDGQWGYEEELSGTASDNTVNIEKAVTVKGLYGGAGDTTKSTGNTLNVKATGVKADEVKYFQTVAVHSLTWDTSVAALEATTMEGINTLDITDLKFYTDAAGTTQKTSFEEGESMALLKSVNSDLSSVKLDYKSGDAVVEGATITTEGIVLGGGSTEKTESDGVNGVKLTQIVTEKVLLADEGKTINYSCDVGDVTGVTFNADTPITFSTTEVARDLTGKTFATYNTINAEGLKFKETNEAIAVSDSMTLISNATGITTKVTKETGKTVAITNYEDSQKIKYNATASGTVTSDESAVKYTVGSVTVSRIDLSGWTGTASDLTQGNTSGWTGVGVAVAGSFTAPDIAANSSQDIVITNKAGFFTVDKIDDSIKYAAVDFSDDEANGVTLAGSQSKGVQAASDGTNDGAKLVYTVGTKDVTGITLGSMTVGTPRDMNTDYNFAGVTTLDASGLTFDKPEDVSADMNLVRNAAGIPAGMDATAGKDHTQSFEQTAENNVKLTANLKGTVTTDTSVVKYAYGGKELTEVALKDWNGNEATFDATGWTKGASAAIETAGLSVTVDPGVEKTVLTVSGVDLTGITVNGEAYQWKDGGDSIAETSAENGVKITAGETKGGGIKGDGNKIIYKGSSKTVTGLEVTSVDFVKDGVAREFKNDYDLTNADITVASGISVSNTASMNAGDTMIVVDAEKAIANTKGETLQGFTVTPEPVTVDFKDEKVDGKELTFEGTHKDTLSLNDKKTQVVYKVGEKEVNKATFTGEVAWNDSEAYYSNDTSKYKIAATNVDATALKVTGTSTKALQKGDAMTLLSAEGMTATLAKDQSEANKAESKITVNYSDTASGIAFGAEATGGVKAASNTVKYEVTNVTLNSADLKGWNGTTSSVPEGWTVANGATVKTDGMTAPEVEPGKHVDIIHSNFSSATISGENAYQPTGFKEEVNGVTLEGKQNKGVTLNSEKKHLIYAAGTKNTASVSFGAVEWQKDATLADAAAGYDFTNVSEIGTDKFDVTYAKPEDVAINDSMTLLKANKTLTAIVDELKTSSYKNYEIAPGVLIDGSITGTMSRSGNDVVFTATANQADKLTFTNVEWKDSGALLTRPANVMFAGADVDTAKINFHNIQELAANSRMTLVSDFGETVGTITGDTFTVGSGLQGEGAASLSGTDLVFTAKTGAESLTPTEATHETVMAMEAGTAVVAAGREYVDSAVEGLGLVSNMAPDGTSTFASMGGGVGRYKTGSHVDTHTWSAVVAVGSKREHKKGNLEWGVFAEYGRGNYTLHDDNGGRGDGNTHYAGGGLLAKWTNKHDVYTEASFRMGRMSDSASNMLRDVLGNTYGYDVHANYFGGHVGLGKIYKVKGNKDLDVYGKFFYTRRNGVDFDAGGNHYSLDSVASKLLRIGARYGSNDRKWNWYGGLAYEYEFGGESRGSVDGLAIRSASIKGASVRGEIGVRLEATKTNPWKADISIYGYGGKHRGIGGTVSVAYMF